MIEYMMVNMRHLRMKAYDRLYNKIDKWQEITLHGEGRHLSWVMKHCKRMCYFGQL